MKNLIQGLLIANLISVGALAAGTWEKEQESKNKVVVKDMLQTFKDGFQGVIEEDAYTIRTGTKLDGQKCEVSVAEEKGSSAGATLTMTVGNEKFLMNITNDPTQKSFYTFSNVGGTPYDKFDVVEKTFEEKRASSTPNVAFKSIVETGTYKGKPYVRLYREAYRFSGKAVNSEKEGSIINDIGVGRRHDLTCIHN
jgi:hypothetical protein